MNFSSQVLSFTVTALFLAQNVRAEGTSPFPENGGSGGTVPGPFNLSKDIISENPKRKKRREARKLGGGGLEEQENITAAETNEKLSWPWEWFGGSSVTRE